MQPKRLWITGSNIAVVALLASAPVAVGQTADPPTVLERYYDARSRGDLAGAMSVVAPDAVYTTGPCAPVCTGAEDIQRREVEPAMANGGQYTMTNVSVSGNMVSLQIEVRNSISREAGIDRFLNAITAEVEGGKIVAYHAVSLPEDPQTARYLAYSAARTAALQGGAPAQVPAALPRTGDPAPTPTGVLLQGAGGALLLAGLVLRKPLRR